MTGTAGWVLVAGAVVFLCAAFAPSSMVFGMKDPEPQREFLARHARSWRWGQIPFAAGALVSAVGLGLLGHELDDQAIHVAGIVAAVASLPWCRHCWLRARSWTAFLDGSLPGWHFPVFEWGTLAALATTGTALLSTDFPTWTGWYTIATTAVFTVFWLTAKDLPPFVFYLVTVVLGVVALSI